MIFTKSIGLDELKVLRNHSIIFEIIIKEKVIDSQNMCQILCNGQGRGFTLRKYALVMDGKKYFSPSEMSNIILEVNDDQAKWFSLIFSRPIQTSRPLWLSLLVEKLIDLSYNVGFDSTGKELSARPFMKDDDDSLEDRMKCLLRDREKFIKACVVGNIQEVSVIVGNSILGQPKSHLIPSPAQFSEVKELIFSGIQQAWTNNHEAVVNFLLFSPQVLHQLPEHLASANALQNHLYLNRNYNKATYKESLVMEFLKHGDIQGIERAMTPGVLKEPVSFTELLQIAQKVCTPESNASKTLREFVINGKITSNNHLEMEISNPEVAKILKEKESIDLHVALNHQLEMSQPNKAPKRTKV